MKKLQVFPGVFCGAGTNSFIIGIIIGQVEAKAAIAGRPTADAIIRIENGIEAPE